MRLRHLLAVSACVFALSTPALADHRTGGHSPAGHWGGADGWHYHSGWHGDMRHFDHGHWEGGHWWHGPYGGRIGWWWIVGPDWYWYPEPIDPYPDPYLPPGATPGYWYYCDFYHQYYPYVGACPSGWRAVPAQYQAEPPANLSASVVMLRSHAERIRGADVRAAMPTDRKRKGQCGPMSHRSCLASPNAKRQLD